jgi:hypothetical protein
MSTHYNEVTRDGLMSVAVVGELEKPSHAVHIDPISWSGGHRANFEGRRAIGASDQDTLMLTWTLTSDTDGMPRILSSEYGR